MLVHLVVVFYPTWAAAVSDARPAPFVTRPLVSDVAHCIHQFRLLCRIEGRRDSQHPCPQRQGQRRAIVKLLSSSFEYCAAAISKLTDEQLRKVHNSPDGRLPGRQVLLALYVHVAHHRGQAEIYLRDKGIKPRSYRI
jgi:uncharacterized damage-inducible protein DinB